MLPSSYYVRRLGMCACTLLLLPATACFLAGRAVCARQPDYHAAVLIAAAQARKCPALTLMPT